MNLLLDTHILLWAAYEPSRLSDAARDLLLDNKYRLHFSVASLWEVAIKSSLGKPDFSVDVDELRLGLVANDYTEVPIAAAHVLRLPTLPSIHSDPFDRMLVAQAMAEFDEMFADEVAAQFFGGSE